MFNYSTRTLTHYLKLASNFDWSFENTNEVEGIFREIEREFDKVHRQLDKRFDLIESRYQKETNQWESERAMLLNLIADLANEVFAVADDGSFRGGPIDRDLVDQVNKVLGI